MADSRRSVVFESGLLRGMNKQMIAKVVAPAGHILTEYKIRNTLGILEHQFTKMRVLVLIPDHTRSLPLPFLFRSLVDILHETKQLDFMVALGTHPPLREESIHKLV